MTELMSPTELISTVSSIVARLPACIAGSSVAAEAYGLPLGRYADLDVLCFTPEALVLGVERLRQAGFEIEERYTRVWARWLKYGMKGWHTNSLKMLDPVTGAEVNLVYKLVGKKPLNTLAQVLESFDFGLLGMGYDLERGTYQDLRSYMFPGRDIDGPLPMMPLRRDDWRQGFMSQYQGLRQVGRYAKYVDYGYDMSEVKDDLYEGYMAAGSYMASRTDSEEKQLLSSIYYAIADKVMVDDVDELKKVGGQLVHLDQLDEIMEALE